jgi:nucleoid-associated protein YgaU
MYKRRRRSPLYYVLPLLVAAIILITGGWPFRDRETIPAAIPTVADGASHAYRSLDADFRSKISEADFADMYQRMVEPDAGAPNIQRAWVTDAIGPERARARFRVAYAQSNGKAEYHFELLDDAWQLQSFTRVTGQPQPSEFEPSTPVVRAPKEETEPAGMEPTQAAEQQSSGTESESASAQEQTERTSHAAGGSPRRHEIQAGENLSAISKRYYGTVRYWPLIKEANPGLNPRRMRIGREIVIPRLPEKAPKPQSAGQGG